MSEGNKTELPTPKKIEDSEKEGNFLFSDSIVTFVTLFVGISVCYAALADVPQRFDRALQAALVMGQYPDFAASAQNFFIILAKETLPPAFMLFGFVALASILSNIVQVGFVFQLAKIKKGVTFEQGLNPVSNAKNLFSKHTLAKFFISFFELAILVWGVYYDISSDTTLNDRLLSCQQDALCGLWALAHIGGKIALLALAWTIPVVASHYLITAKFYEQDNMMSKDEKEREFKEQEGDPEMKSHRKQFAHELINGHDRLPSASVVLRNPTHIAIALRYEPNVSPMPYVLGVAKDASALAIIANAQKLGVPLYTNVPFARALVDNVAANEHVPLAYSESIVPLIYWLKNHHPERVFTETEFASTITRIGDVKR
jgi:flagellar biosynthesis protein FlhB